MSRSKREKKVLRDLLFSLMLNSSNNMIQPPEDYLPSEIPKKVGLADESKIHVLAVDDSFVDRKVIERLLRTSSYRVTAVDSASRALEILGVLEEDKTPVVPNAIQINLIITDYCMPGMTGYDLLKRVKECSSLREIPVIIMSSENVPNRIQMCLAGGAEDFLLKPVKISDVKRLEWHVRDKKQLIHTPCTCSPRDSTDNSFAHEDMPETDLLSLGSSDCFKRKAPSPSEDPQVHKTSERRSRHNLVS